MRRTIFYLIFFFSFFLLLGLYYSAPKKVLACVTFGAPTCAQRNPIDHSCVYWITPCTDEKDTNQICNAGSYACSGGCCPVGGSDDTPPDPGRGPDIPCSHSCPNVRDVYSGPKSYQNAYGDNLIGAWNEIYCEGAKKSDGSARQISCSSTDGSMSMYLGTSSNPKGQCSKAIYPDPDCPIRKGVSGKFWTQPTYSTYPIDPTKNAYPLSPGTVYYIEVTNYCGNGCHHTKDTSFITSCGFNLPSPGPIAAKVGVPVTLSSNISGAAIDHVSFVTSDKSTVSVIPVPTATPIPPKPGHTAAPVPTMSDTRKVGNPGKSSPYQLSLYPIKNGNATITENVFFSSSKNATVQCSNSVQVAVNDTPPVVEAWWQVINSDVMSNDKLESVIPSGNYFSLPKVGFPGVAAYSSSTTLTSANVSTKGWLANSTATNAKAYSFDSFLNQVPSEVTLNAVDPNDVVGSLTNASASATPDANGYYWFKYDGTSTGDLTIPQIDLGDKKVVLFVDNANTNITGNINLNDGKGFFMLIGDNDINVDPSVGGGATPNLEGLYFADGTFSDDATPPSSNTQLHVRGSVVAGTGITMGRDLGGPANIDPAELFEYAPDQIMLFPKVLGSRKMDWKEVAP